MLIQKVTLKAENNTVKREVEWTLHVLKGCLHMSFDSEIRIFFYAENELSTYTFGIKIALSRQNFATFIYACFVLKKLFKISELNLFCAVFCVLSTLTTKQKWAYAWCKSSRTVKFSILKQKQYLYFSEVSLTEVSLSVAIPYVWPHSYFSWGQ